MKLTFHEADIQDVQYLVKMLADDPLGAQRERFRTPLPQSYLDAFEAINRDDNNELVVAANMDDQIVGFLQLTFIPYLTYQGGWRALIEGCACHTRISLEGSRTEAVPVGNQSRQGTRLSFAAAHD